VSEGAQIIREDRANTTDTHARFEEVMRHTDHARCLFTVIPNDGGKPAMIHFEFIDRTPSALERPARRIFFSLKKGITWQEAEELAVHLNMLVATMDVADYALGD
jgi:hypothetical protein